MGQPVGWPDTEVHKYGWNPKVGVHCHIVRNSFWIKKNRESDNEGKFYTYLKCRIWICNNKKK